MPDNTRIDRCLRCLRYAICGVLMPLMSFEGLAMIESKSVFIDPQVMPMAEAIIRGDVAQIHQLATEKLLEQRGDQSITLLQWAILNQQPKSLLALLEKMPILSSPVYRGTVRCILRPALKIRVIYRYCWIGI